MQALTSCLHVTFNSDITHFYSKRRGHQQEQCVQVSWMIGLHLSLSSSVSEGWVSLSIDFQEILLYRCVDQ